jgi:hypothetical protein
MARPAKIEVAALNIRIPKDKDRDYVALLVKIVELRVGLRVYGDKFVALTRFNSENFTGTISKYSEIDTEGEWFDTESFDVAEADLVSGVQIPDRLRPNLVTFDYILYPENHILVFETYSGSKSLSAATMEKYFKSIVQREEVKRQFGWIEIDTVKCVGEVERILGLPMLKELKITIRRPNPDGLPYDLAEEIENRLFEQNGEEYIEVLRSNNDDGLKPNDRTKDLAYVAADNGQVSGKSVVNGMSTAHHTDAKPMLEVDTYFTDETSTQVMFRKVAGRLLERVKSLRSSLAK